jgi:eukaryotic-like serine/threonine-protein kinase
MIGSMVAHYRILEKIGEGGMGVVYKASDTKLDRSVALKFLPGHLSRSANDKKRFMQEARAASALDHPNICTIYEIHETPDGDLVIVMPAYDGSTLSKRIEAGPLKIEEVLGIAVQLADGLHAAHENGIIHRDLKSGNILLTGKGKVKIIDFGLARKDGATQLTKTGSTLGTIPYMSPEQARGEKLDARSDIWSLGVIIYQMISGRLPFQSTYDAAVVYAILNEEPEPITSLRSNVPMELERIVTKAMQKDRNFRYGSVEEILVDLKTVQRELNNDKPVDRSKMHSENGGSAIRAGSGPDVQTNWIRPVFTGAVLLTLVAALIMSYVLLRSSPVDEIRSIAVLPLSNLSGDPEQEYFSDGMTDALITDLAGIAALRVISRTSVMQYKGTSKRLPEIARELNVDAIVEGTVMRSGQQVRITAQLIDARAEKHLWASSYTRSLHDILLLQNEVARAIADEIRIQLTPQELTQLASAARVNTEAYEAVLKGRYFWNRRNPESLFRAIGFYEQAIAYDPDYADAYRGLAASYMILSIFFSSPHETFPKAKENIEKALAINERVVGGNLGLGAYNLMYKWDWPTADSYLIREIELNPGFDHVYNVRGLYFTTLRREAEAVSEFEKALQLDPLSSIINTDFGNAYYMMRQYDKAIKQCQRTVDIDPGYILSYVTIAAAYAQKGEYEKSIATLESILARIGDSQSVVPAVILAELGYVYARSGQSELAKQILAQLDEQAQYAYTDPYFVAFIYTALGEYTDAFKWLDTALEARSTRMIWLDLDPKLDPVRSDPRFVTFREKVGFIK